MRLRRALQVLVVLAFASLGGCELIIGVRDITETDGGADEDGSSFDGSVVGMDGATGTVEDGRAFDAIVRRDGIADTDGSRLDATRVDAADGSDGADDVSVLADAGNQDAIADSGSGDVAASPYELIDDMELNTGQLALANKRNGYWFTYGDPDGGVETPASSSPFTDSMVSPPRTVPASFVSLSGPLSGYAAELHGGGFLSFAGMGVNFVNPRTGYDASNYVGFVFWGRMGGDSSATAVRFLVPDANTDPQGGICSPASKCNDYFGFNVTLTTSWQQFTVLYSDLAQMGFGSPLEKSLDAMSVYGMEFQVSTHAPPGEAFDIWIDDIYFIRGP